jgi:hypothetical protein
MPKFTVQMDEEEYRIQTAEGNAGPCASYGCIAHIEIGEYLYYALVEDADADEAEVIRIDSATAFPCTVEEVEFSDDGTGIALVDEDEGEEEEETVP